MSLSLALSLPSWVVLNLTLVPLGLAWFAYLAGVIIWLAFMNETAEWTLTLWGRYNMIGGVVNLALTFPVMFVLEKAHVRDLLVA